MSREVCSHCEVVVKVGDLQDLRRRIVAAQESIEVDDPERDEVDLDETHELITQALLRAYILDASQAERRFALE